MAQAGRLRVYATLEAAGVTMGTQRLVRDISRAHEASARWAAQNMRDMSRVGGQAHAMASRAGAAFQQMRTQANSLTQSVSQLRLGFSSLQGVLASVGVGIGGGALIRGLINTNREFQRLAAQLHTVQGSAEAGRAAFRALEQLAASTPFQIENLTSAFVTLRALGTRPTEAHLLALGDLASSFSRDIGDVADAVRSAAAGMTQPLKGLGFQAEVAGSQIRLSFGAMQRTVSRDAQSILDAVSEMSRANFAGAMAREMDTLNGIWSNTMDNLGTLARTIGEQGGLNAELAALATRFRDFTGDVAENGAAVRQWTQLAIAGVSAVARTAFTLVELPFRAGRIVGHAIDTVLSGIAAMILSAIDRAVQGINWLIRQTNRIFGLGIGELERYTETAAGFWDNTRRAGRTMHEQARQILRSLDRLGGSWVEVGRAAAGAGRAATDGLSRAVQASLEAATSAGQQLGGALAAGLGTGLRAAQEHVQALLTILRELRERGQSVVPVWAALLPIQEQLEQAIQRSGGRLTRDFAEALQLARQIREAMEFQARAPALTGAGGERELRTVSRGLRRIDAEALRSSTALAGLVQSVDRYTGALEFQAQRVRAMRVVQPAVPAAGRFQLPDVAGFLRGLRESVSDAFLRGLRRQEPAAALSTQAVQLLERRALAAGEALRRLPSQLAALPAALGRQALRLGAELLGMLNPMRILASVVDQVARNLAPSFDELQGPLAEIANIAASILTPILRGLAPVIEGVARIFEDLGPVVQGVMQLLTPILMALLPVLQSLVPVVRALFPLFQQLAVGITYAVQIIAYAVAGVATVAGVTVQAVAALLSLLPGLGRAAQIAADIAGALLGVASGALGTARAMAEAREQIRAVGLADELDRVGVAANRFGRSLSSLSGIPEVFRRQIEDLRWRATQPEAVRVSSVAPTSTPARQTGWERARSEPQQVNNDNSLTIEQVIIQHLPGPDGRPVYDGRLLYEAFQREVRRRAAAAGPRGRAFLDQLP